MMYNDIYSLMAETGIATKLNTACYFNKSGQIIESEDEAYGRKSEYMLVHPENFSLLMKSVATLLGGVMDTVVVKNSWCQITSCPKFMLHVKTAILLSLDSLKLLVNQ